MLLIWVGLLMLFTPLFLAFVAVMFDAIRKGDKEFLFSLAIIIWLFTALSLICIGINQEYVAT
jgi:hypothetical protein